MNTGLGDLRARKLAAKPGVAGSLLCGTFAQAVYGSTNGGLAWTERSTGISEFGANAIAVHGAQRIWAGGPGIALSTNGGADWTFSDFQDPGFAISAIAPSSDDPSVVWAASRSGSISRSTNGGLHWTIAHDPPSAGPIEDLVVDPTDARYVYALADWSALSEAHVVRTTDGGTTWSAAPLAKVEFTNSIAIQPGAPSRLLAGTYEGLWESMDRGATFHVFAPDLVGYNIRDVVFSPSEPSQLWVIKGAEGVYRSTDGGLTFVAANSGLGFGGSELVVREFGGSRTLFAIAGFAQLYQSTNDGDSWTSVTGLELADGVGTIAWQAMADRLFAGTPHGIYVLDFETTAVGSEASPAASSLRVTGPWPNPLVGGGEVVLELEAASPSPFTLAIYDATGRWVRGLAGRIDPRGTTIRWNGRNARGGPVASGTYLLRMSTQGQELIRKVQIVR